MANGKMHTGEVETSASLVRRLLKDQFPQWAALPIEPVLSAGTDNAIYRLGDDLAVRLPRIEWATGQARKEQEWLPKLAPYLPLTIPVPLAIGEPGHDYPWHWSICPWLDGENATRERIADLHQAAVDLAGFIRAMWRIDTRGGPRSGPHNSSRGVPLIQRDSATRAGLEALQGVIDTAAASAAWEAALRTPAWNAAPVWIHGDLQSGNLLAVKGRIHAVIDFGCLGVGDPASDLIVAWNFLTAETRDTFRTAVDVDDATWNRGRGWALSVSLVALPYYQRTNPLLSDISRYTIRQVLTDHGYNT